jgi:hypothetical protein
MQRRLIELARLGFRRCLVPAGTHAVEGIEAVPVRAVREALDVLLGSVRTTAPRVDRAQSEIGSRESEIA